MTLFLPWHNVSKIHAHAITMQHCCNRTCRDGGGANANNKKQGRLTVTLPLACCLLNIYSVFIGKLRMKKYYFYLYYLCVVPDTKFKIS